MKTEFTRLAAMALVAGIVAVPSLTRGLTSGACGKERKAEAPLESTSSCSWDQRCSITTLDPPNYFCGSPATPGHYCQNLDGEGGTCTQESWMTIEDGVCLGQAGAWRCIDVNNEPWWSAASTAIVPCYEGVDFELCPPQS